MNLPLARRAPRLPGVYVETGRPQRADALPRMDVAGFVGFAASGPLDVPVPVEDLSRFRDIFGPDVVLARDLERQADQTSLMGPAVEAFFANGGRRAFVVRVAGPEGAQTLSLGIPQLVDTSRIGAVALARSPGRWITPLGADTRLVRRGLFPLVGQGLVRTSEDVSIRVTQAGDPPVPGDLIEATFNDFELLALLVVDRVEGTRVIARANRVFWYERPASSLLEGAIGVDDDGLLPAPAANVDALFASPPEPQPDSLSVLTFDLILWEGARISRRLDGLGFAAAHPRYWAALPDDPAHFGPAFGRPAPSLSPGRARFLSEASVPRFPLAGPATDPNGVWLPHAMKTYVDRERCAFAILPPGPRLEAEGLEHFSSEIFLDLRFAAIQTHALAAELAARHTMELTEGGRPLRGLHALYPVDEVAMIVLPDAGHRPWNRRLVAAPEPLAAPHLCVLPNALDAFDRIALSWTPVNGATRYRVELSPDDGFDPPEVHIVEAPEAFAARAPGCPAIVFARVRAETASEIGPWSNERASMIPEEDFEPCAYTDPVLLSLLPTLDEDASPGPRLTWTFESGALAPGDVFEVQTGQAPNLGDARTTLLDPGIGDFFPIPAVDRPSYMRVRVLRGEVLGPWSITLRLDPGGVSAFTVDPNEEYATVGTARESGEEILTAVHRAAIRFAAARADAVALLSMPRHFRADEAKAHLARLSPLVEELEGDPGPAGMLRVPALRFGEETALSYAALHHGWISTGSAFHPQDGAAAGLIARQANGPGVWIASANMPVTDALALTPQLADATLADLIAHQINPVRDDPRGFLFLNAETLSASAELTPLPVRLLMILLRRLAEREGMAYTFEPNSPDFRAQVQRRFERMLSLIHQRGGFAGTQPAESFRVVTDRSVNPPGAIELGRFTVELRVAPSRPMRFLNVRLLRTGAQDLAVEEAT